MKFNALLLIFVVSITGVQSAFPDWTMEHLNARNDRNEVALKLPLRELWKKQYYGGGEPILMNGKFFILKHEEPLLFGKIKLIVLELDLKTGKLLRKHIVGEVDKLKYRRMIGYQGKLYISTTWLDLEYKREKLLVNLWAYDVNKKSVIWKFEKLIPFSHGDTEKIGAWLNADCGKVFLALMEINESEKLYCFDADTGKLLWSTAKPENVRLKNSYPIVTDRKVFMATDSPKYGEGGYVAAFDINSGNLIWQKRYRDRDEELKLDIADLGMVYTDSRLYVPFVRGIREGTFVELNPEDGHVIWKFSDSDKKASFFHYVPLVDQNSCYVIEYDDFIYKLNKKAGKLIWKHQFPDIDGYPVLRLQSRDYVAYSSSRDRRIFLVFVNKVTGKEIARYEFQTDSLHNRYISDVIADKNTLVVGLYDGTYTAFEGAP